ncbi:MAG: hypothetical protein AAF307_00425 [Pseudomonadota bacterium]
MELIADILLAAGALGAAFYCFILGRRLKRFNDLEKGVGGAVAVLSAQVDDLTKTLAAAQTSAAHSAKTLTELVARAEGAARQLELQMASLHDLPDVAPAQKTPSATASINRAPEPEPTPTASASLPVDPVSGPMFVRRREEGRAV